MSNMNDVPAQALEAPSDNGMTTIGYRVISPAGFALSGFVHNKLVPGIALDRHETVVLRSEAEAVIANLKDEHDERGIDIEILVKQLAEANRLADAWKDTAAMHHRNEEFWQGLVRKIGLVVSNHDIGVHIADDRTWNPEPLALKVVESIEKAYAPSNRFQRALRILITGK